MWCRNRRRTPCQLPAVTGWARCRLHGGAEGSGAGTAERLGVRWRAEYDRPSFWLVGDQGWGVLRLVETGVDGSSRSVDVMAIDYPSDLGDIAALGLTLAQGKQLVALVQQEIVTAQSLDYAVRRPPCRSCGTACQVKDYRPHQIATLFGQVTLRLPRFRCAGCGGAEAGVRWPAHCRSTPELDQVRAQFSAYMPYRVAAGVLEHLLPIDAGIDPETPARSRSARTWSTPPRPTRRSQPRRSP